MRPERVGSGRTHISAWAPAVAPTRALVAIDNSSAGAVYTGLALASDSAGRSFLYAAIHNGFLKTRLDDRHTLERSLPGFGDARIAISNDGNTLFGISATKVYAVDLAH